MIDHHRKMVNHIDNAVIFYHEPFASSASEMVTELVQYLGDSCRLNRMEAEALLSGIMLDTKNFVMKTGVRTFEAAAYLRRLGADTDFGSRAFFFYDRVISPPVADCRRCGTAAWLRDFGVRYSGRRYARGRAAGCG